MRKLTIKHTGCCCFDATIEHNGECDKRDSYLAITIRDLACTQMEVESVKKSEHSDVEIQEIKLIFRGAEEKETMAKVFRAFAKELEDNLWFEHI